MNQRAHHTIAGIGLVLLLGIPASWVGIAFGALQTFGNMSGDIAQAASEITGGVALALRSAAIGQSLALVGLALLLIALFGFKVREPWVLKWGRYLMIPWLIFLPVGTVAGILMLVYFSRHKEEFTERKTGPSQRVQTNAGKEPPASAEPDFRRG